MIPRCESQSTIRFRDSDFLIELFLSSINEWKTGPILNPTEHLHPATITSPEKQSNDEAKLLGRAVIEVWGPGG